MDQALGQMISRGPFSNVNYSIILVSIITGALFPELRSGASGSQVTSGTGERFDLELGQPYWCCPSRNVQETTRYSNRHLVQSSTTGCSGHRGRGPGCCLEGRSPTKLSLPRQQASRSSPLLGPSDPSWERSPQLPKWRSKRSLTLPPERGFLGSALSTVEGVQKPRTPPSLEKALALRGQKKILRCFYSPFRPLKALLFAA